jgi:hypothetical protein
MIQIEFKYSQSRSSEDAIINSLSFTEPKEIKEGKNTIIRINLKKKDIKNAFPFLKALKRLKNKKVFVDGTEKEFDTVFGFLDCYREKLRLNTRGYCFGQDSDGCSSHNIFGCVASTFFYFGRHGKWSNRNQKWTFKKKEIREALALEVAHCTQCPAFNQERMDKIITAIPISVNPLKDKDWAFIPQGILYDEEDEQIVEIEHPNSTELLYIEGVRIVGENAIDKIGKRAGYKIPTGGLEWVAITGNLEKSHRQAMRLFPDEMKALGLADDQ